MTEEYVAAIFGICFAIVLIVFISQCNYTERVRINNTMDVEKAKIKHNCPIEEK